MSMSTPRDENATNAALPWIAHYPAGVDWAMPLPPQTVPSLLAAAVKRFPGQACTRFIGKTITYQDMAAQVDRAAHGLQQLGVGKGTKVGLLLPNCPSFIVYYYATLKAGGVIVNFNPLYTVEELEFQVKDSETELMVTLDLVQLFGKVEALIVKGTLKRAVIASFTAQLPPTKALLYRMLKRKELARPAASKVAKSVVYEKQLLANAGTPKPADIDPVEDVAVLQYTGGTTGTPKGAMLTHANLTANVAQTAAWSVGMEDGKERILAILPFFHVFAMTGIMNLGIAKGAELILLPRFVLDDTMRTIAATKPTIMPGVPTIFNAIMNHKDARKLDLKALKICLSGGAPLPHEVQRGFAALTGNQIIEAYGLSETSPAATFNPLDGHAKDGSIGQPLPGTTISIRAVGEPEREMRLGEAGEICIKGPQVMKGYWRRPAETADAFVGAYFRTGDIGYMDNDGFIFIVDRLKDMIIASGFKVFPRKVEEAIYEHPAVEEVTVIGIKNAYRGEAPKAFIKLKAGQSANTADILKHLEPKLSKIEMPEEIEFRSELPKTMIGKLSKKELKAEEAAKSLKTA